MGREGKVAGWDAEDPDEAAKDARDDWDALGDSDKEYLGDDLPEVGQTGRTVADDAADGAAAHAVVASADDSEAGQSAHGLLPASRFELS